MTAPMSDAVERQVFIEIHPFHAVSLFPYYVGVAARTGADQVLAHERLFGQDLFDAIPAPKSPLTLFKLVAFLWRHRIQRCHFNTINTTLSPITTETTRLTLLTLLLPLVTRLCGCRNAAIVHEADQFFETGIDQCRRNIWFRRIVGCWFIRLFDRRYVLAPEVVDYLDTRQISTTLLAAQPLATFAAQAPMGSRPDPANGVALCSIGPIIRSRKNWKPLAELDGERLRKLGVTIRMLCDITVGDGPEFRRAVQEQRLDDRFMFLDHRPSDDELFSWVRRSAGIVCLYGGPEYGTIKTSGARFIASAFRKPYIGNTPALGVYDHAGRALDRCESLDDCIDRLATRIKAEAVSDRTMAAAQ
jgi:hypothetical protein